MTTKSDNMKDIQDPSQTDVAETPTEQVTDEAETVRTATDERIETVGEAAVNDDDSDDIAEDVVLHVSHVSKTFRLPTEKASGLKQAFINWPRGIKGYTEQHVLRDISFDVHRGDFFGIVGRNGSGKSTLLKLISGIYKPNSGQIVVKGKLVSFIELGVGFNPELSGRENVYLNGALLGFTREEIDAMYDEIVEFAELEDFMDQKLKNYSSGMQVRLAFSVAIKARGDILVLDEVLAVGDEAFQRKCDEFFTAIKKDKTKTVILVTHDMSAVKKYCNRAILIKDGVIIESRSKDDVADRYSLENLNVTGGLSNGVDEHPDDDRKDHDEKDGAEEDKPKYPMGLNERVPVLSIIPVSSQLLSNDEDFVFDVEYQFDEDIPFYLAFTIYDLKRGGIPYDSGSVPMTRHGHQRIRIHIPLHLFTSSDFKLVVSLREDDPNRVGEDVDVSLRTLRVAFTNEDRSCLFSVRNDARLPNFALILPDRFDLKQHYVALDGDADNESDAAGGQADVETDGSKG